MNEIFFRTNFSSALSTRKYYDKNGKRIARLDIELPGPLLDPSFGATDVSLLLTKASIPLSQLPKLQVNPISIYDLGSANLFQLDTNNVFLWGPFFFSNSLFKRNGQALYKSVEEITLQNLNRRQLTFFINKDKSREEAIQENMPYYYDSLNSFENDINEILAYPYNDSTIVYPDIRVHFEESSIRILFSLEAVPEGTTLLSPLYGKEKAFENVKYFSLCMSKENAEIFHNLPLVDISKYYSQISSNSDVIKYCERWGQYALNLEARVPDGFIEEAGGMWMYFDFHFFNPISLTPFTSIIIYSQDLPINSQVHGFVSSFRQYRNLPQITFDNSTTQVTSSAQISTLPILDVFYPLLSSENDLQDVLIISKDVVSTAGPIKLNTKSLTQFRNFSFNIGYIAKDGTLHNLLIPENANLSIQLTFIIKNLI